jgi:hypothetical protein
MIGFVAYQFFVNAGKVEHSVHAFGLVHECVDFNYTFLVRWSIVFPSLDREFIEDGLRNPIGVVVVLVNAKTVVCKVFLK